MEVLRTFGINNCGGRCIIDCHVENGKILRITTDKEQGTDVCPPLCACPRGLNYHKTYENPETRLKTPLIRTGERGSGRFREAGWEEAIDLIANEWIRIRDTYGPASRYVHYAWGVSALVTPLSLAKRLLALDGGYLDYYNSYSSAAMSYTLPYIYGSTYAGNTYDTLYKSELIILWGHNPAETRFDQNMYFLQRAAKKGIPIICIDPRCSKTAQKLGAEWIPIRPSTDAALMDAMAYVIITEDLYDDAFIRKYCIGFTHDTMPAGYEDEEDHFSYVLGKRDGIPKTPAWAEKITGVPADKIRDLAGRYASARPAALIQGLGPQRNLNGEQVVRGGAMLAALTGNVGKEGGWSGTNLKTVNPPAPSMPKIKNPFPGKIPVYRWTDALENASALTEKEGLTGVEKLPGNIKMILNLAGNALINQHGDINRTKELLKDEKKCEFIVCSDVFLTPSAMYADVVLPAASFLEGSNIVTPWTVGDFIGYVRKVVEPIGQSRFEYDWLKEVAAKLGLYEEFTEGHETVEEWLEDRYELLRETQPELPGYEEFRRTGIYRYPNQTGQVAFRKQIEDPENHSFETPSGKIEIFSPALFEKREKKIPGIPKYVPASEGPWGEGRERYPLQLVGYHTIRRCHSIHDNNPEMERLDPQTVHMNPADAGIREISDGDPVRIFNDRGEVILRARVTDHIQAGVVAMAQGAWYQPDKTGTDRRGNINTLTSLEATPLANGNGQHTNLVEVQRTDTE